MAETRPRVELREVIDSDLEVFHRQQDDPEANARARFPARAREPFLAHWRDRVLGSEDGLVRTVLADGEVAGNIVCWWDERRMIGYWLGREFWGRGVGGLALPAFLDIATWRPLYADPHADNTASVRLLRRCGFETSRAVSPDPGQVMLALGEPEG